jgi:hypothetical protein
MKRICLRVFFNDPVLPRTFLQHVILRAYVSKTPGLHQRIKVIDVKDVFCGITGESVGWSGVTGKFPGKDRS